MKKSLTLELTPDKAYDSEKLRSFIAHKFKFQASDDFIVRPLKRSVDARSKKVKVRMQLDVYWNETPPALTTYQKDYPDVSKKEPVIIVGAGPAGMFAALRLIELGYKPIILERGKDVRARRRDLADINKKHIVNPESNYCFGEGGAGTYSDGKLYTRSKKRGDFRRILEIFVAHGASEEILVDNHPHIGTNKLPKIVQAIRESILNAGGAIHFETKVTDFIVENNCLKGVITENGKEFLAKATLLATGHSARDIFHLLKKRNILIEFKPFALGVRVEHPQQLIDQIQYHTDNREDYLPASSYALVQQVKFEGKERGVFSFCMCPGGFIVPSATAEGEIVVNGMSPSRRNSQFANSGMVVSVGWEDLKAYHHHEEMAALSFQQDVEKLACQLAGNSQKAPAQRLIDFVKNKVSSNLPEVSYQPGLTAVNLSEVLPEFISKSLKAAFPIFGKRMKGYFSNEAQILGVESRTSSPIRIPRSRETYEHPTISGFFPCGEGAGYAGGIASAAMDGERCAEKIVEILSK